jgi:transcriptional regulator with XRE-family HTH domain
MDGRQFHGAKLREVRQAAGIRMIDLARAAGCSYGHLRMAETGTTTPDGRRVYRQISTELAYRIAHALTRLTGRPVTIDAFSTPVDDEAAA